VKNVKISIPSTTPINSNVVLKCLFELEHDETLYSVKWYLGEEEFCRYLPKESPKIQTFNLAGLSVDVNIFNSFPITSLSYE